MYKHINLPATGVNGATTKMDDRYFSPLAVAILLIAAGASYCAGQVTFTAPNYVGRTNFGVQFFKVSTLLNGVSHHKHTAAVRLPHFTYGQIPKIPCDSEVLRELQCGVLNAHIDSVNADNSARVSEMNDQLAAILGSVQSVGNEKGGGLGGRKRRQTTTLGPDYCDDYESDTGDSGGGGGLLGLIGSIGSSLFGTPTFSDLKAMSKNICAVSELNKLNADEIIASTEALNSISKNFDSRMSLLNGALNDTIGRIDSITNLYTAAAIEFTGQLNDVSHRIELTRRSMALRTELNLLISRAETHLNDMRAELAAWETSVEILNNGQIPPHLISKQTLSAILDHLETVEFAKYNEVFSLMSRNVKYYYELHDYVTFTRSDVYLYVTIKIPITTTGGELSVYRVDTHPVPMEVEGPLNSRVQGLLSFVGFTIDNAYFAELTVEEYISCKGTLLKTCVSQRALQSIQNLTCAAALFLDAPQVTDKCEFYFDNQPLRPTAYSLGGNGRYLIHSINSSTPWYMSCPGASPNSEVQTIAPCQSCRVRLPCGCSLTTPHFAINAELSTCDFNDDTSFPVLTQRHVVNAALANLVFPPDALKYITGDSSTPTPISLPVLALLNFHWNESLLAVARGYSLNMKSLLTAFNAKASIYETRSDALKAKIDALEAKSNSNSADLNASLTGGSWLGTLLTDSGTVGSVTLTIILVAICAAFALYVCCRPTLLASSR